jgi:hypothetical protein
VVPKKRNYVEFEKWIGLTGLNLIVQGTGLGWVDLGDVGFVF